jgi:hypothetical protein
MLFRSLPRLARRPFVRPLLCAVLAASLGACSDDDFGTTRPTQDASVVVPAADMSATVVDMTVGSDAQVADFTTPGG